MKKYQLFLIINSIFAILLGLGIKLNDFFLRGSFRCGMQKAEICSAGNFLFDIIKWILLLFVLFIPISLIITYIISFTSWFKKHLETRAEEKKELRQAQLSALKRGNINVNLNGKIRKLK